MEFLMQNVKVGVSAHIFLFFKREHLIAMRIIWKKTENQLMQIELLLH